MGLVLIYSISTRSQWPLVILGLGNRCMFPSPFTGNTLSGRTRLGDKHLVPSLALLDFPSPPIPLTKVHSLQPIVSGMM